MRRAVFAAATFFAFACDSNVDQSLEQKECNSHGECLPGWTCSEDQICIRIPPMRGNSQGADLDAGPNSDAMVVTGVGPSRACDAGTQCAGSCVDLERDVAHCGACGRSCPNVPDGKAACNAGLCGVVCEAGYTPCGGGCFRLSDHVQHCGACGNACPSVTDGMALCAAGKCEKACNPGFTLCGDACVRLDSDAHHCGKCGKACPEGDQCSSGSCVRACPAGTTECSRSCVDTDTDAANCGSCGTACKAPMNGVPACHDGACSFDCQPGFTPCGDACLDVQTDLVNCGECGRVCPPTAPRSHPVCAAGACGMECNLGFLPCDGHCISPQLLQSLGGRTTCAVLAMQQDRVMCQGQGQNTTFCGGECVNVQQDERHCGRCDRACAPNQSCFGSTCLNISF